MTTNAELMQIAMSDKHKDDKAIQSILIAVSEANGHERLYFAMIKLDVELIDRVVKTQGYFVTLDATMQEHVNKHAAAVAKLHTLFFTLACALQALGEKIEY